MVENEKQHHQSISLSPRDDLNEEGSVNFNPNFEHYESKLLWAIENRKKENIKNIAITGYYGAGKSSILKTFIKSYDKKQNTNSSYKFLELSLATFHDDKEGADKVKDIEKSLLQQIFYKVEDDQIPNSRLKKISNKIKFNFFEQVLICFIVIALLVRFYNLIFGIEPFFGFYWLDVGLMITTLFFFLLQVDKINQLSFKKISYRNLEVELEKNKGELSVLSRFLDEIIYFFKETKYNVVVIEDIDRFESTEIFSNLRELNLILNNSDLIKQHIVFIYAIKNEQFKTASDRTKFFDFIIPVIPVVNFETAAHEFKEKLKKSDIDTEWLNENMINSLFFLEDDIRVINNTFNELITYYKILNKQDGFNQDVESKTSPLNLLVPILFYKNVNPYDFSCLLKRKGSLYKVINSEEQIKEKHISILRSEIIDIKKKIEDANTKAISDIDEIKILVLSILQNIASKNLNLSTGSIVFNSVDQNNVDNIFDYLIQDKKIIAKNTKNSSHNIIIDITKVEEKLNFKIEERIRHISNKNSANQLIEQIESIEESIKKIKNQSLAQTIKKEDIGEILKLKVEEKLFKEQNKKFEKKNTNLLLIETLILNDYINKDYFLYLSDYTKLGMSVNDYKILISIKNKKNIGFEKEINDPSSILKRISPSDYNSNAILNFDLVDYILKTLDTIYNEEINYIVDWLSKFNEQSIEFITKYYPREKSEENVFIKYLSIKSKDLWIHVMNDNAFENHRDNIYELIIKNAPKERLVDYCKNSDFNAYIEIDPLSIFNIEDYRLKFLIDNFNEPIKLKKINIKGSIDNLHCIFNSNSYEINLHNIDSFIQVFGIKIENYKSKLITLISQMEKLVEMKNYIYSNNELEPFIKNIILQNPANTKEEESVVLEILNMPNEKIDIDTRIQFLEQQETVIKDVTEIEELELRITVLKNQRMSPELDNVLCFLNPIREIEKTEDRNALIFNIIKFITENKQVLEEYDETQRVKIQKLIDLCISSNKIDNELYVKFITILVDELPDKHFEFTGQSNLNADKIKILIEENYLDLNEDNIEYLIRESQQELLPYLFEKNEDEIKTYLKYSIHAITEDVAISILKSQISQDIKTEIVNNRFAEFKNNEPFFTLALQHIITISGVGIKADIKQYLINHNFDDTIVPKIFNAIVDELSKQEIKTFFSNQNGEFLKLAKHKKKPLFDNTDDVRYMLEFLEKQSIITGFHPEKNKYRVRFVKKY